MLVHQQPAIPPAPAVVNPASATRKRRRRAPATGAAEDCFTCRANGTKCDRRRPYCGPCLDISNECKGYRTQLTWNVGVASRGKLRGMTLPVSIESNISVAERDRRCAIKKKSMDETAMRTKKLKTVLEMASRLGDSDCRLFPTDLSKLSIITNYDFVHMEHPSTSGSVNSLISKHEFPRSPRSPDSAESPYSTNMASDTLMMQQSYPSPLEYPQQRQEYHPSTMLNFHKSPYSHDPMNQTPPSGLIVSTALSDFDRAYTAHSEGPYTLSPSPSDSPLYERGLIVSSEYLPPTATTVTSSMPSYGPLISSEQPESHFLNGNHVHQHRNHHWSHIGMDTLHHTHITAAAGNLSDLLYGDEMLGTF